MLNYTTELNIEVATPYISSEKISVFFKGPIQKLARIDFIYPPIDYIRKKTMIYFLSMVLISSIVAFISIFFLKISRKIQKTRLKGKQLFERKQKLRELYMDANYSEY